MFRELRPFAVAISTSDQVAIRSTCAAYLETEMAEPIVLPTPANIEAEPEEGPVRMRLLRTVAVWLQSQADSMALPLGFYAAPAVPKRGETPAIPSRLMVRARG